VLTFPNYIVIGGPVLSALWEPTKVKTYMGLLLLEQVSVHITVVAVIVELCFLSSGAPHPKHVIAEHNFGALSADGPPRVTDEDGYAVPTSAILRHVTGPDGVDDGTHVVTRQGRVSNGGGGAHELKVRHSHSHPMPDTHINGSGHKRNGSHGAASPRVLARCGSPTEFVRLDEDEEAAHAGAAELPSGTAPAGSHNGGQPLISDSSHGHGVVADGNCTADAAPAAGGVMQAVERVAIVLRERLIRSPLVVGAVLGLVVSLAIRGDNRSRKLHIMVDQTFLYLQNCVVRFGWRPWVCAANSPPVVSRSHSPRCALLPPLVSCHSWA
jgi:predicted permease